MDNTIMAETSGLEPAKMEQRILTIVGLICAVAMAACGEGSTPITPTPTVISPAVTPTPRDTAGPTFNRITTSSKSFAIDCVPTSITVTANIADPSGVTRVMLWYRVGTDQPYTPVNMDLSGGDYSVTVKALDVPVGKYGAWEFYLTAEDGVGNLSESPVDTSVQLLPCVG